MLIPDMVEYILHTFTYFTLCVITEIPPIYKMNPPHPSSTQKKKMEKVTYVMTKCCIAECISVLRHKEPWKYNMVF